MEINDIKTEIQINTTEGSFKNKDGKVIFTRQWSQKDKAPRALIMICHGFGEHSGRYADFLAPALVKEGFLVTTLDHVGHGKSEGERAQVDSLDTFVGDVFHNIDQVTAKYQSLPMFIFGHSMGGAITILCALQRPKFFQGVLLSAPAILVDPSKDNKCMRCLGNVAAFIYPSLEVIPPIDPGETCRNPDKVEEYRTDPLVFHGGIKAGLGMALANGMDTINAKMKDIDWPFLVMHGDADSLALVEGSIKLEKMAKSQDKTIKIYEGYYHEILNEPREYSSIVLNDIIQWLRERLS
ncbi:monoglyceride lipase [Exaiptasia diaphana]|uniref:Serine aminopeptidase S33 domain-containing protein n=1 Tax=Exaiptasia diaphana TaxID=2652724 RepID=A0A913XGQ5_EXADI|nr:monoglyceride lipase [Exaiptasia diaphana]KXJ12223.1 Monoglyceride lipase [Exaiptasia diaphana]